ncbi:MAG: UDP-N-acetylglucosamine--N-acetylmuramyl-(pentapeptide) pyrophosphoryl-undecaprenol N-acetylglucosamine transferase [Planctomycetes bacterium]|nr:UDP-N-acetylglucosamine--N-acetylmuramyl-(pentapeptide) pyrophosphoryl-undecaprenol N-acetylglucosamine transferase [Planctomycetota bacterium]
MASRTFFFAGGGTGGHLYPALAVASQLTAMDSDIDIRFLCSNRPIDDAILSKTSFEYTPLSAQGLGFKPASLIRFARTFRDSARVARAHLENGVRPVVVGVGGFASSPVCWTAHRLGLPTALINVDSVPGKANRLNARWASAVFIHFEDTVHAFARFRKAAILAYGCPLRDGFSTPQPSRAITALGLDANKKILLITGASSGCQSINDAVARILPDMAPYAHAWQVVHLTGHRNYDAVSASVSPWKMSYHVLAYYDQMPDLMKAADVIIGRSGAVSVAEYAASGVPSICMPYPHHRDRHQYINASKLVDSGAAIMVDDLPDLKDRSEWLWEELEPLLKYEETRLAMAQACRQVATPHAARRIAAHLLSL